MKNYIMKHGVKKNRREPSYSQTKILGAIFHNTLALQIPNFDALLGGCN
jgi:hypothetical protein